MLTTDKKDFQNIPIHDVSYKGLFENKSLFLSFLYSRLINFDLDKFLDGKKIKNVSLYSENSRPKEPIEIRNDLVWKVEYGNQKSEGYFLVILEFQSSVDKLMPLRIGEYTYSILKKISKSERIYKKLPTVIPCVLYNGKNKWNIPRDIFDLFDKNNFKINFSEIYPHQSYYFIDFRHFEKNKIKNFNAPMKFILQGETADSFKVFTTIYDEIMHFFQNSKDFLLHISFLLWMVEVIWKRNKYRWKKETKFSEEYKKMDTFMQEFKDNPHLSMYIDEYYNNKEKALKYISIKEAFDIQLKKLNSTEEKLNSTEEKLNSTEEKLNNTTEELNITKKELESKDIECKKATLLLKISKKVDNKTFNDINKFIFNISDVKILENYLFKIDKIDKEEIKDLFK